MFDGFSFLQFDTLPPPTLEGHIWLISSSPSTIQLSVGTKIVGLKFLFGHEIQRSTLQKFADLWDTKCSVTSLATLCSSPQCVFGFKFRFVLFGAPSMAGSKFKPLELSMSISKTNLNAHQVIYFGGNNCRLCIIIVSYQIIGW